MASSFSPIPTNLMGLSTTLRIDIAAPPRVSPSSLVSTTPSKFRRSLNALAVFTASCPVIASTTKSISCGLTAALMFAISFIICSSTAKRPAVSIITISLPFFFACFMAFSAMPTGLLLPSSVYTGTFIWLPSVLSCSIAAGRYTSQATNSGCLPRFDLSIFANLPENVVLPLPCSPDINTTAGEPFRFSSVCSLPIRAASSSWTIFTISSLGLIAVSTFIPKALFFTSSVNVFAVL